MTDQPSDFTLGPRYGSEDMQREWREIEDRWNAAIQPGSTIAYQRADGTIFTDTVQSVHYRSAEPAIWPELSWWQRMVRRLTPARWRKPLKPIRPAGLPTVSFTTGPVGADVRETYERTQANLRKAGDIIDGIIK